MDQLNAQPARRSGCRDSLGGGGWRYFGMKRLEPSVFINVPYDAEYAPLMDAVIFTSVCCGFLPRSPLETGSAGIARLNNLILEPWLRPSIPSMIFRGATEAGTSTSPDSTCRSSLGWQSRVLASTPVRTSGSPCGRGHNHANYASDLLGFDLKAHDGTAESIVRHTTGLALDAQSGRWRPHAKRRAPRPSVFHESQEGARYGMVGRDSVASPHQSRVRLRAELIRVLRSHGQRGAGHLYAGRGRGLGWPPAHRTEAATPEGRPAGVLTPPETRLTRRLRDARRGTGRSPCGWTPRRLILL